MPDHLGDDMRKTKAEDPDEKEKEFQGTDVKNELGWIYVSLISPSEHLLIFFFILFLVLDEKDIAILKTYVSSSIANLLEFDPFS